MMSANNIKNVNHNREQEQDKTNVEVKCVEFQPPVDIEETKDEYILNEQVENKMYYLSSSANSLSVVANGLLPPAPLIKISTFPVKSFVSITK